ncbi:unnamed protein product [Colias eurytheme]|nr:unnamed protein product [Colias eurytheme]
MASQKGITILMHVVESRILAVIKEKCVVSLQCDTTLIVTTDNSKKLEKRPKRKRISDMRIDVRGLKCATALRAVKVAMYESSCSYSGALELKRSSLKEEPWPATEWPPYRLHQSTFEQLKQSVEKAKAALQDRSGLLGTATAFGDFYGGQLGQDATSTIGFGRTSRTEESMLGSVDKNKGLVHYSESYPGVQRFPGLNEGVDCQGKCAVEIFNTAAFQMSAAEAIGS